MHNSTSLKLSEYDESIKWQENSSIVEKPQVGENNNSTAIRTQDKNQEFFKAFIP